MNDDDELYLYRLEWRPRHDCYHLYRAKVVKVTPNKVRFEDRLPATQYRLVMDRTDFEKAAHSPAEAIYMETAKLTAHRAQIDKRLAWLKENQAEVKED